MASSSVEPPPLALHLRVAHGGHVHAMATKLIDAATGGNSNGTTTSITSSTAAPTNGIIDQPPHHAPTSSFSAATSQDPSQSPSPSADLSDQSGSTVGSPIVVGDAHPSLQFDPNTLLPSPSVNDLNPPTFLDSPSNNGQLLSFAPLVSGMPLDDSPSVPRPPLSPPQSPIPLLQPSFEAQTSSSSTHHLPSSSSFSPPTSPSNADRQARAEKRRSVRLRVTETGVSLVQQVQVVTPINFIRKVAHQEPTVVGAGFDVDLGGPITASPIRRHITEPITTPSIGTPGTTPTPPHTLPSFELPRAASAGQADPITIPETTTTNSLAAAPSRRATYTKPIIINYNPSSYSAPTTAASEPPMAALELTNGETTAAASSGGGSSGNGGGGGGGDDGGGRSISTIPDEDERPHGMMRRHVSLDGDLAPPPDTDDPQTTAIEMTEIALSQTAESSNHPPSASLQTTQLPSGDLQATATTTTTTTTTTTVKVSPADLSSIVPSSMLRMSPSPTNEDESTRPRGGKTPTASDPSTPMNGPMKSLGNQRRSSVGVTFQSNQNALDDFNEEDHLPPLKNHFAPPKQLLFLHPNSTFKTVWSILLILFIMYSLFEVPLSIGFGYTAGVELKAIAYFIDCFFIVDVVLNFFTGYFDAQLELVHEPKLIAMSYLKGWFAFDAIGSIPFDLISLMGGSASGTKAFFVLRALKIPRLFRMVKLTQVLDVRSHRYLREVIRMVKLVLIMVVIGHWIACGFMLTARSEAAGTKTWADPVVDSDLGTQYVFALYWSLTVLSTVGFGDIVPLTLTEMIYTCVVMLMGALLYAVVVGNVMLVLANLNAPSQRHTEEIMKVADYMRYRKFPPSLVKKVIDFTEAEWKRMRGYNEREVMAHLPDSLQTEIARHLHAKMLTSVSFFKDSHSGFINAVVLAFHTAMLLPNTIMIRRNQPGDKMFFVSKGSVELLDRGQVYAVLQEGSYVGESALLDGLYRVTARTATYCELCILYRSDFDRIVKNYPEFIDIVSAQAEQTSIMASKKDKLKALFS